MCLLLRHDLRLFELAQVSILDRRELQDSSRTIECVFEAVEQRCKDLVGQTFHLSMLNIWSDCHTKAHFRQQRFDPNQRLETVAGGLVCHLNVILGHSV